MFFREKPAAMEYTTTSYIGNSTETNVEQSFHLVQIINFYTLFGKLMQQLFKIQTNQCIIGWLSIIA